MKSLKEFINESLIETRQRNESTFYNDGVLLHNGYIDDILFEEYVSLMSEGIKEMYSDDDEALWQSFIEGKYGVSDSFIREDGYQAYHNRLNEAHICDALNENLGAAEKEISDTFKPTIDKKHGNKYVTVSCISDIIQDVPKVRVIITTKRKLTDDELQQLKDIATKHKCYSDVLSVRKIGTGTIKCEYFVEEDEDEYLKNVDDVIYNKKHGILWHLTTKEKANSILKNGLEVRTERKISTHPPRIYFLDFDTTSKDIIAYKDILKVNNTDDYVLLKIDLKKTKHKYRFFKDGVSVDVDAYFTREPISPHCISVADIDNIRKEKILVHVDNFKYKVKDKIMSLLKKLK